MQGMARYSRTVRLLREQLMPPGRSYDNPRNSRAATWAGRARLSSVHPAVVADRGWSGRALAWRLVFKSWSVLDQVGAVFGEQFGQGFAEAA